MNLLFFLTPKCDVCVMHSDYTLRQAVEKLNSSGRSAIPVIDSEGHYRGTASEGDLLRAVLKEDSQKDWEHVKLMNIIRPDFNPPVNAFASIEDLLQRAMEQNFVPVVDDRGMFIGIVTRKAILRHFIGTLQKQN